MTLIAQTTLQGKAVRILDGDTFELLINQNAIVKVRLSDIDAPEKKQDFGQVSKQTLASMIFGKNVKVTYEKLDRNKRILGNVFIDNVNVNLKMVEKGMAWHFKKYSSDQKFANAEIIARKKRIGLWSMSNPIAPWEYRFNAYKH
jgi:endonuclease YncB( thermonuclease family)